MKSQICVSEMLYDILYHTTSSLHILYNRWVVLGFPLILEVLLYFIDLSKHTTWSWDCVLKSQEVISEPWFVPRALVRGDVVCSLRQIVEELGSFKLIRVSSR